MLLRYPILVPLTGLICGIALGDSFADHLNSGSESMYAVVWLVIILLGWILKHVRKVALFLGFAIYPLGLGVSHTDATNYSNQCQPTAYYRLVFQVSEPMSSTARYDRYRIFTKKVDHTISRGKSILYVDPSQPLQPGKTYTAIVQYRSLPKPYSPLHFSIEQYRRRQGIHGIFYLTSHLEPLDNEVNNLVYWSTRLRSKLMHGLAKRGLGENNAQLVAALLWGDRSHLDENLQQHYRKTGAVHILSVSGLHVSIIAGLIYFLTRHLVGNRWAKWILATLGLVAFAAIAGFSPTVNRAALQMSCLTFAPLAGRYTNGLAMVFLSALFLLLIEPAYLWDIGFQLSYAAVIGIVTGFPIWKKHFRFRSRYKRWASELIGISLIAQLFTLPISLYYFHQFPGLFLLTNLIVLPWVSVVMTMGIICCLLNLASICPDELILLLKYTIELQNHVIKWIANFSNWHWENIYFREREMLLGLIILGLVVYHWEYHLRLKHLRIAATAIGLLLIVPFNPIPSGVYICPSLASSEMVLLNMRTACIYSTSNRKNEFRDQGIQTVYQKNIQLKSLLHSYQLPKSRLLRVDKKAIADLPYADYLWLTQNSRINLNDYLNKYTPRMVIADGSSSALLKAVWKQSCNQKNIPFHDTSEKGYYKLE